MLLTAILASALAQSPAAVSQRLYEAEFSPLLKSERRYSSFGPVGPFYPQVAIEAHKGGEATLSCQVTSSGTLEKCKVVAETPTNYHFGIAARVMADRKRISVSGTPVGETIFVRVPFVLGAPATVERQSP